MIARLQHIEHWNPVKITTMKCVYFLISHTWSLPFQRFTQPQFVKRTQNKMKTNLVLFPYQKKMRVENKQFKKQNYGIACFKAQ